MSWNTKMRQIRGTNQMVGRLLPIQKCNECNEVLPVLFKDDPRNAETWFWRDCDTCLEPVCENCSDTSDDGDVTCVACMETITRQEDSSNEEG